jgi:hypothetical protein
MMPVREHADPAAIRAALEERETIKAHVEGAAAPTKEGAR